MLTYIIATLIDIYFILIWNKINYYYDKVWMLICVVGHLFMWIHLVNNSVNCRSTLHCLPERTPLQPCHPHAHPQQVRAQNARAASCADPVGGGGTDPPQGANSVRDP